jgi:hypothetical protein
MNARTSSVSSMTLIGRLPATSSQKTQVSKSTVGTSRYQFVLHFTDSPTAVACIRLFFLHYIVISSSHSFISSAGLPLAPRVQETRLSGQDRQPRKARWRAATALTRAQQWTTDKSSPLERRITMTENQSSQLITYVDSSKAEWPDFRPGSRRKVLYEDPKTGQLTMLVQWDAGYRMGALEHHEYDEHLHIIAGTFVDERT